MPAPSLSFIIYEVRLIKISQSFTADLDFDPTGCDTTNYSSTPLQNPAMNADDIEACNAGFFGPAGQGVTVKMYCPEHAQEAYIADHDGEKCSIPHCNRTITARENLPQLCSSCHYLYQGYAAWLQEFESSKSEDHSGFSGQPLNSTFDDTCSMCKLLKLARDRQYRKKPIDLDEQGQELRYTPLGIFITGTPYSITHFRNSSSTHRPHVSWAQIRSWIVSCDYTSGHHATDLQFTTLLSLDPFLIDVDDSRLIRMSVNLDIYDGSPTANGVVYAALSYVWGGSQPMLTKKNMNRMQDAGALLHPTACSRIVRDAMLVCRRTGVRYLWVSCLNNGIPNINEALVNFCV